jgi:hypothetical protein
VEGGGEQMSGDLLQYVRSDGTHCDDGEHPCSMLDRDHGSGTPVCAIEWKYLEVDATGRVLCCPWCAREQAADVHRRCGE